MGALLQQVSNTRLPKSSVLGVGVINPGAGHGGDCELGLLVGVHYREGCRKQAIGTMSNDGYVAKCAFLRDAKYGSEGTVLSKDTRGAGAIVVRHRARCRLDQSPTRGPSDGEQSQAQVAAEGVLVINELGTV